MRNSPGNIVVSSEAVVIPEPEAIERPPVESVVAALAMLIPIVMALLTAMMVVQVTQTRQYLAYVAVA